MNDRNQELVSYTPPPVDLTLAHELWQVNRSTYFTFMWDFSPGAIQALHPPGGMQSNYGVATDLPQSIDTA
ncbi:hypothetical protein J1614_010644 [Plenodomus biglobosus]|nr:hypothetical protein J1614_010644 [Plenodomus biglobosus]